MKQNVSAEHVSLYRTLQWVVFCFSVIFIIVLSNGYYNLFVVKVGLFAIAIGTFVAFLAWGLAKFIGRSPGGITDNIPLFTLLLIISALGVFNSLMINLEGKRIVQEAIDSASHTFGDLAIFAKKTLNDPRSEEKRATIEKLKALFFGELDNPLNCGQGPVARQIAMDLNAVLPGFRLLEGKGQCKDVDRLKKAYTVQINELISATMGGYIHLLELRESTLNEIQNAQNDLATLRSDILNGGNIVVRARNELEKIASTYQNLAQPLLSRRGSDKRDIQEEVKGSLDMDAIRNLGEWSQLVNLIISRIDKPTTYVYIVLAFFFDWILVYLFGRLSDLKGALPSETKRPAVSGISSPW